jgi:hypothetical protein
MNARHLSRIPVVLLAVAIAAPAAFAEGVAVVTGYQGDVSIEDAAGGSRTLNRIPDTARVVNGTLGSGDELRTGPGNASADARFPDGGTFRAGPATRVAVSESPIPAPEGQPGPRSVRRGIRLGAGLLAADIPASETTFTHVETAGARVRVIGAKLAAALAGDKFRVAVDGGRAVVEDASGRGEFPLGVGQEIEIRAESADATVVRVAADGGRSIRATVRAVRVDLTTGDVIRIAPGPDGALMIEVVNGPVQVVRGGGAVQNLMTGDRIAAKADAVPEPVAEPGPASKPAPAEPKPVKADPKPERKVAPEVPIPPMPEVHAIDDTVEGSPVK